MQRRILPALRCAFPYTIPILAGFAFLGMTYGIYMRRVRLWPLATRC